MMNTNPFHTPVKFLVRRTIHEIGSPSEALNYLQTKWPAGGGSSYVNAERVLISVLQGARPIPDGRRAFLRAAEEAGLFILE
jgi:hypothetical protein